MSNLFTSSSMAAGYASARPAVHPRVIERVAAALGIHAPVERALDVGCGAGLSTRALQPLARLCCGIEPVEAMLRGSASTAPGAVFAAGAAELLPVRSQSVDLVSAAGSLNYVDLDRFFPEVRRVLRPHGWLVAYDFSQGCTFSASSVLQQWFAEFRRRYPPPTGDVRPLDPEILAGLDSGLTAGPCEHLEIWLPFTAGRYLDYVMTETNVAMAIGAGAAASEIREWCRATLDPLFAAEEREVLFRAYYACFRLPST